MFKIKRRQKKSQSSVKEQSAVRWVHGILKARNRHYVQARNIQASGLKYLVFQASIMDLQASK
jgi:hypothetical protein